MRDLGLEIEKSVWDEKKGESVENGGIVDWKLKKAFGKKRRIRVIKMARF